MKKRKISMGSQVCIKLTVAAKNHLKKRKKEIYMLVQVVLETSSLNLRGIRKCLCDVNCSLGYEPMERVLRPLLWGGYRSRSAGAHGQGNWGEVW